MSLAIYRKYRPRLLADLLGQEAVSAVLETAARRDKLAHAYLFYGPRGTGKTTAARLLAKIANCETRTTDKKFHDKGEPCNRCEPCKAIDAGQALDVVEIDAASNRGIDEIRSLRESVKLVPSSHRFKVFIIDEAHQLTKEAWNALLKTLEEPPSHAIFVLATTEYEKVPPTIVSRTQRFHFRKLLLPIIIGKLKTIVQNEKLKVDDNALELIAASAEGSLRDAESLLDQLTSSTDSVTLESVEQIIGRVGLQKTATLADLILKDDLKGALAYISKVHADGYNVIDFVKELIHYLRRVMTLKLDPSVEKLFLEELTAKEVSEIKRQSALIDASRHIPLIKALIRAWGDMRYAPFVTIPFEVALIEHLGSASKNTARG